MEIKICGITNREDAICACQCGADALGFIFHPGSPRYVAPERAREIIKALPPETVKVGVFVNREAPLVRSAAAFCGLDFLQLHGDESPEYCLTFPPSTLIKAVSPRSDDDLPGLKSYPVKAVLVDARDGGRYGGTGKKADWALAKKIGKIMPLILAGGLDAENMSEAIEAVCPDAVDVCSGAESSPGKKDHGKVKEVIRIVGALGKEGKTRIFR